MIVRALSSDPELWTAYKKSLDLNERLTNPIAGDGARSLLDLSPGDFDRLRQNEPLKVEVGSPRLVTPAATDSTQARQARTLRPLSGQFEFLIGIGGNLNERARGQAPVAFWDKAASRRASSFARRFVFWLGSQVSNSYGPARWP